VKNIPGLEPAPADTVTVTVPVDAPLPVVDGFDPSLFAGRTVPVATVPKVTLRHIATLRTPAGRPTADAVRARRELDRCRANRRTKRAYAKATGVGV